MSLWTCHYYFQRHLLYRLTGLLLLVLLLSVKFCVSSQPSGLGCIGYNIIISVRGHQNIAGAGLPGHTAPGADKNLAKFSASLSDSKCTLYIVHSVLPMKRIQPWFTTHNVPERGFEPLKMSQCSCTHLGLGQMMEGIIIDIKNDSHVYLCNIISK